MPTVTPALLFLFLHTHRGSASSSSSCFPPDSQQPAHLRKLKLEPSAVFPPCQLSMPCHGCALPVTQTWCGDKLGTVGEGDPEREGLDFRYVEKQQRSLKALEPLALRKKKLRGECGQCHHISGRMSGAERTGSLFRAPEEREGRQSRGEYFVQNVKSSLTLPRWLRLPQIDDKHIIL